MMKNIFGLLTHKISQFTARKSVHSRFKECVVKTYLAWFSVFAVLKNETKPLWMKLYKNFIPKITSHIWIDLKWILVCANAIWHIQRSFAEIRIFERQMSVIAEIEKANWKCAEVLVIY